MRLGIITKLIRGATCFAFFILISCKDEDIAPTTTNTNADNQYVNSWIQENMAYWYLWEAKLPTSVDLNLDPEDFFSSLLYSEDRFSWIQADYQELLNSLQGVSKEAGFEFTLYRENSTADNVIAQILYIKPASPAAAAGLKRGDIFSHVNGQQITVNNYQTLLDALDENYTLQYRAISLDDETFDSAKTVSLAPVEYQENPNFLNKVIESGGHKIGYYVYNFFASSADGSTSTYDNQMESIFSDFKSKGITDLVLDLRFNSGGSETSANTLASLLGTGVDNSKVFLKREYNETVQNDILNDPSLGQSYLTSNFQTKSANVGAQLLGSRLYVLTSSRTASASELIINSLKPYMDVFIVGDTTYGKNVGSISLYEENDPKNKWGMQPIVVKVFNSLGQSDYAQGFSPSLYEKDNSLILYPLGDEREVLLSKAIEQITGQSSIGRIGEGVQRKERIGFSLDRKRHSFNLFVDGTALKKLSVRPAL